jgi:hypothetical protein
VKSIASRLFAQVGSNLITFRRDPCPLPPYLVDRLPREGRGGRERKPEKWIFARTDGSGL